MEAKREHVYWEMVPQIQRNTWVVMETLNDFWSAPCDFEARVSYAVCDLGTRSVVDDSQTHVVA